MLLCTYTILTIWINIEKLLPIIYNIHIKLAHIIYEWNNSKTLIPFLKPLI